MIIRPTLSWSHWWYFVYTECCLYIMSQHLWRFNVVKYFICPILDMLSSISQERSNEHENLSPVGQGCVLAVTLLGHHSRCFKVHKASRTFLSEEPGRYVYSLGPAIENVDESCKEWFNSQNEANIERTPAEPCPCTKEQAVLDGRFVTEPHLPGCYISRHEKQGMKQTCCYQGYVSVSPIKVLIYSPSFTLTTIFYMQLQWYLKS